MSFDRRPFDVRSERSEAGLVVAPSGEIDLWTAPRVTAALSSYEGPDGALVLDLRAVTFMDSSGLGLIVEAQRRARERSFRFVVAIEGTSDVHRILEISGMAKVIELVDDPAAVLT
jgi:anti-anti-sigma factor